MTNRTVRNLSIALIAFLLTGCGVNISGDSSSDGMGIGGGSAGSSMGMEPAKIGMAPAFESGAVATQSVIRTADLTIETSDVSKTFAQVKSLVETLGGRIESSSVFDQGQGFGPNAYLTVRVAESKLDSTIDEVSKVGKQTALNIYTSDVTLQTIDLKAKVAALTTSRDRLLELLDQASTTADLIAAEQALAARQSELDSYQSQLDYLESQVSESTLTIQIVDDASSVTNGLRGIQETLLVAAQNFLKAFENIVIFIGTAIPWLLVAGLLYPVVKGTKRLVKKRKAKK